MADDSAELELLPDDFVFGFTQTHVVRTDSVLTLPGPARVDDWRMPVGQGEPWELTLKKGRISMQPGAGVILGAAGMGKSLFADYLRATHGATVIKYREPEKGAILRETQLAAALAGAIRKGSKLIVVDSLRTLFYASTGATGRGGVNMGIFELLTAFDQIAQDAGVTIWFALNPMTAERDQLEFYFDVVRGAVTYSIYAERPFHLRVSSRFAANRDNFDVVFGAPKEAQLTASSEREVRIASRGIADLWDFSKAGVFTQE